jgi:CRISPR-associated protein Csb2
MGGDPTKVSSKFSGKSPDGVPLRDHSHLYVLPLSADRVRIDRVLLFTRGSGLGPDEVRAVLAIRELYGRASDKPIRVMATWRGRVDDEVVRPLAKTVKSTTPFVPSRHWRKGRDPQRFLETEIRRECANQGLPEPVQIVPLEKSGRVFEWVEFRRNRKDDPVRPLCSGFQLDFLEPVPTPFSLGYACHFGLGQFEAV